MNTKQVNSMLKAYFKNNADIKERKNVYNSFLTQIPSSDSDRQMKALFATILMTTK